MFGVFPSLPKHVDPSQVLPFFMNGQASLAAADASSVDIASTSVQTGYVAVILSLGVTVRTIPEYEYTGNIIFALNIDGSAFIDNNNGSWTSQRGSVAAPVPTFIRTKLGSNLVFVARRSGVAAIAQTIAFLATGFMYPDARPVQTDAARFRI